MKKAQLPSGQILIFPEDTTDDAIKAIVKKIVAGKGDAKWDSKHVKELVRELTNAQGEIDLKRAEVDHFGPAIAKQTDRLEKSNKSMFTNMQSFAQKLLAVQNEKLSKFSSDKLEKSIREVAKQIVGLTNKVEAMVSKSDKNTAGIMQAMMANTKAVEGLVAAQNENTKVLKQLVEATRAPKKITRDEMGRPEGIE